MNRKAGLTIEQILAVIVGIVVVGLVLYFLFNGFGGKAISFFKNLPKPGQAEQTPEVMGRIHYDIQTDSVQIYDGTSWNKIEGDLQFVSVGKVSEDDLKSAFNGYYFDHSKRSDPKIYSFGEYTATAAGVTRSESSDPNLVFPGSTTLYKRGATMVNVQNINSNNILGTYYIASPSLFVYLPSSEESPLLEQQSTVVSRALNWRNSILVKPLILKGMQYCATLSSDRYLDVDLTKPGACDAE